MLRFELGTFYALAGNRCFVSFFQNVCCLVITIAGQFEFEEFDGRQKESVPITDAGNLSQDENIVTITSPKSTRHCLQNLTVLIMTSIEPGVFNNLN